MKKRKQFRVKAVSAKGEVTAVFATLNVKDHDGDVTLPGAFGEQSVPIVPTHNWGSVPLGKAKIREDGDDAIAKMQFNLDSSAGREWFSALKFDFETDPLQEYSYAFDVLESGKGDHEGEAVQFLKKLKVFEVSPVLLGAGVNTRTLAVKSGIAPMELQFEETEAALVLVSEFSNRVKALATLRADEGKGGRALSKSNRGRLSRLQNLLGDIKSDIEKLLGASDEPKDDGDPGLSVDEIETLRAETLSTTVAGDAQLRRASA